MKNKKTLIIVLLVLFISSLCCLIFSRNKIDKENISLPENYSLDNYRVAEVSNISCKKSIDCTTPGRYLMMSSCPYTSLCIKDKCNVVCPEYKAPTIVGWDRDIHGCIGSAGYSWCEIKNKCLRVWEEKCEISTNADESKKDSCAKKEGVWYPQENICEVNQLSESQCNTSGGEFNNCASACRHDLTAQMCTMQCVLTCTFK